MPTVAATTYLDRHGPKRNDPEFLKSLSEARSARFLVLADLKPSGKYFMNDLVKIGGTVPLIRILVNEGLMHGDCLTVTGKTMKENMKNSKIVWPKDQKIVSPLSNPLKKDSHLVIFKGNLCPEGAVGKISGKEGLKFEGKAIVFESEETALQAMTQPISPADRGGDLQSP